ncbi:hypothetical protein BDK51DRAFT_31294 [Blyttiomyces helicus]|uniref:Tyrosinase copper-binding domain-containing protein n=1 Tax=Blyttiomyces helicus TaxID=388810 RepID=A0A4P9VXN1_9FUNG|nr:hypothetical protein BDK51DRAFT_31294 [Blyttiomyces helicus]|eukprot:RKO83992.1 hypothetical protein BDK51DRAFT_31294 [Blyttiomyces helicus]
MGAQFSPVEISWLTQTTDYDQFRQNLENHPHNYLHMAIGGDMAQPPLSVNDPIFFLHHSNIDRLWNKWQQDFPGSADTYSGNKYRDQPNVNNARSTDMMGYRTSLTSVDS